MINLEIELIKCRERTKDQATIRLMMQAKVDVLDELCAHDDIHHRRNELYWWTIQDDPKRDRVSAPLTAAGKELAAK